MSQTKPYRLKPATFTAFQWNGERPLPEPLEDHPHAGVCVETAEKLEIVNPSDYIVKSDEDTYFVVPASQFAERFEELT